jgi:hypothetical protein
LNRKPSNYFSFIFQWIPTNCTGIRAFSRQLTFQKRYISTEGQNPLAPEENRKIMDKEQIRVEEVKLTLDGGQDLPCTTKSTTTINDFVESIGHGWLKWCDQPRINLMVNLVEATKDEWEEAGEEWPYDDDVVHFVQISTMLDEQEATLLHQGLISAEVYNRIFAQVEDQPDAALRDGEAA